jgi:hypothetical protein
LRLLPGDDIRGSREAQALVTPVVTEHIEPIRVHRVPHDIHRDVRLENLIFARVCAPG